MIYRKKTPVTNNDFTRRWDAAAGLFLLPSGGKGHTPDCFGQENLHSLPDSVSFMTYAAITGRLDEIDCPGILENISRCQFREAEKRGLIKWFLEDRDQTDGNAPFFICIGLIPLRKYFAGELGVGSCRLIDGILSEALHYFMHKCEGWGCFYPNSFLGDAVFAWLINEMCGDGKNDVKLLNVLDGSARYWIEEGWGWGEHMSDIYAMVCNYEISMLLLMSDRLPDETRKLYMEALRQLVGIEEHFGGRPRVPVIRSYSFVETPKAYPFRQAIRDWRPDEEVTIGNLPPMGPLLKRLGWHEMAPPPAAPQKEIEVPCFNGAKATAFIEKDFRIGAMSRYPVMDCCDNQSWGLSWQSFPAAFLHDDGDWGFLQWAAVEDGNTYAHPSHKKNFSRLKGLTAKVNPPIAGNTFSLRKGGNLLVLRRMPSISGAWTKLTDRLRVISPTAVFNEQKISGNTSTMSFKWKERTLSVARVTLSPLPVHRNAHVEDGILDWDIEYGTSAVQSISGAVVLWAFCTDAQIREAPVIKPDELKKRPSSIENGVFDLKWNAGNAVWNLKINPVSDSPYQTIN
ncbi:MAG: hypothetical protein WAX69_06160 [Victivallales bacterium]